MGIVQTIFTKKIFLSCRVIVLSVYLHKRMKWLQSERNLISVRLLTPYRPRH